MLFCSYGEIFSRLAGKVSRFDVDFVKCKAGKLCSYEIKIISVTEISLVNLSKCFLGDRDNFCPYKQAISETK